MKHKAKPVESERLVLRELREGDLPAVLPVYLSNPQYLELTEGSAGEPGRFDLEMLQRDFALAELEPGRVFAGIWAKDGGEPLGVLDWLEENPRDGQPWIGLLLIRADRQRQGLASEAFAALVRERGWPLVRAAVIERNAAGLAVTRRLGFEPIGETTRRLATGPERLILLERRLGE